MQTAPRLDRYYQNGFDVTRYIMNNMPLPMSGRFFEVTVR